MWTVASVGQDIDSMSTAALRQGCSAFSLSTNNPTDCRMPVMLRAPTGLKFEPSTRDIT